mmetsp:Transcript_1037/g.1614  ORF Transcript_1037/g.1614 Transcript_1037/m.1614 type:complete len:307 (+) Transcript_1037:1091-2011(+)
MRYAQHGLFVYTFPNDYDLKERPYLVHQQVSNTLQFTSQWNKRDVSTVITVTRETDRQIAIIPTVHDIKTPLNYTMKLYCDDPSGFLENHPVENTPLPEIGKDDLSHAHLAKLLVLNKDIRKTKGGPKTSPGFFTNPKGYLVYHPSNDIQETNITLVFTASRRVSRKRAIREKKRYFTIVLVKNQFMKKYKKSFEIHAEQPFLNLEEIVMPLTLKEPGLYTIIPCSSYDEYEGNFMVYAYLSTSDVSHVSICPTSLAVKESYPEIYKKCLSKKKKSTKKTTARPFASLQSSRKGNEQVGNLYSNLC